MLDRHEVGDARRFTVPETRIEDSRLPEEAVEDIRDWLTGVAEDAEDREIVISDTLAAVLDSFRTRVPEVARQVEAQVGQRTELAREVEAGYGTALAELDEATRNGSLLRGEVLARWQDFAGTGDLLKSLHVQRSRRGRAANRRHRSPARVRALKAALRSGLESLIMASAEHGAEQVLARWRDHPAGEQVLAGVDADLGHVSPELSRRVTRAVSSWQDHVQELIRTEGVTKRSVAKLVSFDTEAVSLVLMIGLLGYGTSDVAVEGGNSAVPQRLLKALFGAESLRGMGAKARADLRSRIGMLFDEEAIRFGQVLDSARHPGRDRPRPAVPGHLQPRGCPMTTSAIPANSPAGTGGYPTLGPSGPGAPAEPADPPGLVERLDGLDRLVRAGLGRLDQPVLDDADALLERAASGCGSPASTPSSPSRAAPEAASPPCSTPSAGWSCRRPGCAAR
ncbi:hypothetical protein [Actinomadura madurae]|uniref:hypothetical protein n=1 Tax=Actinomadura madurae TaxID=1993 RepID=UPI0020D22433|nr:hypothetical protein [Actinomadura madurae]MCP9978922.1 hypothetical protein [Actinomadura madurae]